MRQLEQSLRRLKTDHLDLWQIHECAYDNDPERHFAPDGVVDALDAGASEQGKVRFVGFTGHKRPDDPPGMLRTISRSTPARCRSTASTRPSARSSSMCCPSCFAAASRRSG